MSAPGFAGSVECGTGFSPSAWTSAPVNTARTPFMPRAAAAMRVRPTDEHRMSLAGQTHVVAVAATAGDEPQILLAMERLPDHWRHDWEPCISIRDVGKARHHQTIDVEPLRNGAGALLHLDQIAQFRPRDLAGGLEIMDAAEIIVTAF